VGCLRRAPAAVARRPSGDHGDESGNPARYEPAGRRFVRWQIAASVLLRVWWLVGGAFALNA
jgi:hypothetical protein